MGAASSRPGSCVEMTWGWHGGGMGRRGGGVEAASGLRGDGVQLCVWGVGAT